MKEDKTSERDLNETEISDLLNKKFKIAVIKILTEVKRIIHKESEPFNKDRKYKKILKRNHRAEEYNN